MKDVGEEEGGAKSIDKSLTIEECQGNIDGGCGWRWGWDGDGDGFLGRGVQGRSYKCLSVSFQSLESPGLPWRLN